MYAICNMQCVMGSGVALAIKSKKEYAIKVGDAFFQLGDPDSSLHICDYASD